jgi:hypothetical protein
VLQAKFEESPMTPDQNDPTQPRLSFSEVELRELLAVYAIDAVSSEEAEAVERYMAQDPRAAAEVQSYRETAAMLAIVGEDAPTGLWSKITDQIDQAPPALNVERLVSSARSVTAAQGQAASDRAARPRWLSPAVAAAVVVILGLGAGVVQLRSDLGETRQDLATTNRALEADTAQTRLDRAAASAMLSPEGMIVHLAAADAIDPTTKGSQSAEAVMMPSGDGYLLKAALPQLDAAETYQLWGQLEDGRVVSLAVLGRTMETASFRVSDVSQIDQLIVTRERAGGVARAEGPVIVAGPVSV